jgi:hypothetical protein
MAAKEQLLAHLQMEIRARMNDMSDYVAAQGGCKDFAEYRYMCGEIQGLAIAEAILLELDDMQHRSDDA